MLALHELFMRRALALAYAQLGRTAPNPAVGCVIVRDGRTLGEAATGNGGRPHAEELALALAGEARGADVYLTLEPCGQRSSGGLACATRLGEAGVARVFIAAADPHPNAAGAGLAVLAQAGVQVELGLLGAEAAKLNEGFFLRVRTGRPLALISADPAGFDAALELRPGEDVAAALDRLGAAGLTRVYAAPGAAAAAALAEWAPESAIRS